MENNQLLRIMREQSNEKLLEILNVNRMNYTTEEIEAAKEVLNERGNSFEKNCNESFWNVNSPASIAERAYASRWKRFAESIIDSIVVVIILFVVVSIIISNTNFSDEEGDLYMKLSGIVVFCSYFFILETLYGKTIGKMLLRTTVVDINGETPKISSIGWRTLCRYIPYEGFSFLFGGWKNHRLSGHWHDRISKTYVVDDKKLRDIKNNRI